MGSEVVARGLLPLNCAANYKIVKGKCYCQTCMMCCDPSLKIRVKNDGCGYFRSDEVQREQKIIKKYHKEGEMYEQNKSRKS